MKKYTDKEIEQIKKWRGQGLTWAEISDINKRSPKGMSLKFSKMSLGVPEYKEPEIPPVIVPEGVSSINERKAAAETPEQPKTLHVGEEQKLTVRARIPRGYTVTFRAEVHFKTLDEVWDYFHPESILMALTSECEVTEVNELVLEEKITSQRRQTNEVFTD